MFHRHHRNACLAKPNTFINIHKDRTARIHDNITPSFCPSPTPEPLKVEPVTSPTDQLTQVITVYIGKGETVTIETESGPFTATGVFTMRNPASVEVTLLPNTVHHLEVTAKVRSGLTGPGDCTYGGYILRTTNDRKGVPLVIVQIQATQ